MIRRIAITVCCLIALASTGSDAWSADKMKLSPGTAPQQGGQTMQNPGQTVPQVTSISCVPVLIQYVTFPQDFLRNNVSPQATPGKGVKMTLKIKGASVNGNTAVCGYSTDYGDVPAMDYVIPCKDAKVNNAVPFSFLCSG